MTKNIVLFSDGTGYSSARKDKTNVWRLFQALDQKKFNQIALYDDGVGTSTNKYLAAIGGAFGWGLKRNVIDLYKFVCRNYEKGDNIYGFGFSRGSFTIRVLVGLIATEGLITFRSSEELDRNAAAAYRHYCSQKFPTWSPFVVAMRRLRDLLLATKDRIKGYQTYSEISEQTKATGRTEIPVKFLGLWDTVEAYGMPIQALKRGIDWVLWPMLFGDLILSPLVQRACHALSLDDERSAFHPLLWDEVAEADMVAKHQVPAGRITQVWFAGVHSNVGGGYPEDQLSFVSLDWLMTEAISHGLILNKNAIEQIRFAKSPYARLYDSRAGFASYYRYSPRQIEIKHDKDGNAILPIIHGSAVMRMAYGSDDYAPLSLPPEFWVLAPDGELLPMESAPFSLQMDTTKKLAACAQPTTTMKDSSAAEKTLLIKAIKQLARPNQKAIYLVWDTVFWRQCLYLCTVGLTLILAAYPWLSTFLAQAVHGLVISIPVFGGYLETQGEFLLNQWDAQSRGPITSIVSLFSAALPIYAAPWKEAFESHSLEFILIAAGIMLGLAGGTTLQTQIHDRARLAWHQSFRPNYAQWSKERQKGARNSASLILVITTAFLVLAWTRDATSLVKVVLSVLVITLATLLTVRSLGQRPISLPETMATQGSFALSVARYLRENRFLLSINKWCFQRTVPIIFALLILVLGCSLANRFLFNVGDTSGRLYKGRPAGSISEKVKFSVRPASLETP